MKYIGCIAILCMFLGGQLTTASALPGPQKITLKNGLTVLWHQDNELPLVSFRLLIPGAGSAYEGADGLADLTAAMLLKGTRQKPAAQIAEELDRLGVSLRCTAQEEFLEIAGTALAENFSRLLTLTTDCLLHPAFNPDEFTKERQRRSDAIQAVKDEPQQAIRHYFRKFYFGNHPLGSLKIGTPSQLERMTVEMVRAFYNRNLRPERAIIAVCGQVARRELDRLLGATLGRWSRSEKPLPALDLPTYPQVSRKTCLLVDKPDASQAYFILGVPGLKTGSEISPQAQVMNTLFGGRFTSWLNSELRIKRGLTYGAGSTLQSWRQNGIYTISSYTKNDKIGEMLTVTFELLAKAQKQGFTAMEVESARNYILGQFPPSLESLASKSRAYTELSFYQLGFSYYDRLLEKVARSDSDTINRIARTLLPGENYILVVIGKADDIRQQLAPFGQFQEKKISARDF